MWQSKEDVFTRLLLAHLNCNVCLAGMKRRQFIPCLAATLSSAVEVMPSKALHVATNSYPWGTFAKRENQAFKLFSDEALAAVSSAGVQGYEGSFSSPEDFVGLGARLKAHGLEMRSLYVNSTLHDEGEGPESLVQVMKIASQAVELGCQIVVTNPSPIRWGGTQDKSDEQLRFQAILLNDLGAKLKKIGLTLAYHNHDVELRAGAREFHHMLTATDPANVKFCLDAHWIYRGCGNSQLALFDAVKHYGDRIVELHLRQSSGGVWNEVFTSEGDIDYARLSMWLKERGIRPHLVLEQAVEEGSPHTLDAVTAHRQGQENVRRLFAWMQA